MHDETITFKNQIYQGAGIDHRVESEKSKTWLHEELFAGDSAVVFEGKDIVHVKRYTHRNQWSSLSCVANGGAITLEAAELAETGNVVQFSHKDIYIRRANRPSGGMAMYDVLALIRSGAATESQVPSIGLNEVEINRDYLVTPSIIQSRNKYGAAATFEIKSPTIDKVAQVISMGIPVILFWYFDGPEWWRFIPTVENSHLDLYGKDTLRHQAIGVDYGIYENERGIWVQDSAGVGTGLGEYRDLRFVPESFFIARNYAAGYAIDKKNLDYVQDEKPRFNFARTLTTNMTGVDVKALQKILVYEGCMKILHPTEFFGGMTRDGVKKLQEKYASKILYPVGLKSATGYVGTSTLKWLKENYSITK